MNNWFRNPFIIFITLFLLISCTKKDQYSCVSCHRDLHPGLVSDFENSKMSDHFSCEKCHGIKHRSKKDVSKVILPVTATCKNCHEEKADQYLKGKHSIAFKAIESLPFTHNQPNAFIKGRKGCGGCHSAGFDKISDRYEKNSLKPKYGMGCINCHTRHMFSKKEAQEPESCKTCHTGFDHAQYEMWSGSKHGSIYLSNRAKGMDTKRVPKCQTCHMVNGNHNVITSWGFFGIRAFEKDKRWANDREVIFKSLGFLDSEGKKTEFYNKVVKLKMIRTDEKEFNKIRSSMINTCCSCHSRTFVLNNFRNSEEMIREADKLMAKAIREITMREKKIPRIFSFYDVNSVYQEVLFNMFMDHRMKSFQAGFHLNPDYSTWYGYARMKQDLIKIKESLK